MMDEHNLFCKQWEAFDRIFQLNHQIYSIDSLNEIIKNGSTVQYLYIYFSSKYTLIRSFR